jgi:pimeloyl-ACP methyl ester carboxylesterase
LAPLYPGLGALIQIARIMRNLFQHSSPLPWMFLMLFLSGCVDRILLFPSTDPIALPSARRVEVQLSAHKMLEVWTALSPAAAHSTPQACVLRFGGNAERAEHALEIEQEEWRDLPVEIWAVNYPGFGQSTGPVQMSAIPPAALAAYDALRQAHPGRPIILSGFSVGTTAALHVAANRPAAGMLLHNPPPLRQLILGQYGWWNLWLLAGAVAAQVPADLDSLKNAKRIHVPAVFILSGSDEVVPPAYQQKVVDAYAGEKRVIHADDATHNTPFTPKVEKELSSQLRWLWEKVLPSRK